MSATDKSKIVENDLHNIESELKSREATSDDNVQLPMLVEIEDFIRKNPLLALGIAILLGVTVGYLLKNLKNSESFQKKVGDLLEGLTKSGNFDLLSVILNAKK